MWCDGGDGGKGSASVGGDNGNNRGDGCVERNPVSLLSFDVFRRECRGGEMAKSFIMS